MKELIAAIESALIGIDDTETGGNDGWWETSTGAAFGAFKLKEVIDLINEAMEGKVIVDADVVATVIKDHSFLANGDLMCVYCGESSYHQKDIAHKDTCPIKAMLSTLSQDGDSHES